MTLFGYGFEQLTRREREIMNAVFGLRNAATAEAIRKRLTRPPSDSSVRVMLGRLEKKGFLRHRREGARFVYSATVAPQKARRSAMRHLLEVFCGGSAKQLVTALVAEQEWTGEELDALRAEIERARQGRS
ncbi:MAG: BlaI/MecI/CopY family transcriptional regulator [Terriglobales bacterium]